MKKKLTLWIMLLPLALLAQTGQDSTQVHKHKKAPKVVVGINPNAPPVPIPDEVKPDFSKESIFKALFVGGVNLSQIEGCGEATYRKVGALVGAGTVIKFSRRFSISAEVLYSQKGAQPQFANDPVTGVRNKFSITSDYVDLPITFSVHDKKILMFGAGIQLSALARYQQTDSAGNNVSSHPAEGQQIHKIDLLGQICGTFFIKQRLGIGLRFAYSLIGIRNSVQNSNFRHEYNNTISIRISYLLDPKHIKWNSKIP